MGGRCGLWLAQQDHIVFCEGPSAVRVRRRESGDASTPMRVRPMRVWPMRVRPTRVAGASTADASTADARVRRYEYGRREYGRCEYADASTADAGMDDVSTADASTAGASTADASRMRVGCVRAQEKSNLLRPVASHVQEGAERALLEGTEGRAGRGSLIKTTSGCEGPSSVSVRCRCRCGVGSESVRSRMRARGGVKPFLCLVAGDATRDRREGRYMVWSYSWRAARP